MRRRDFIAGLASAAASAAGLLVRADEMIE
jgi:hypothetical protein